MKMAGGWGGTEGHRRKLRPERLEVLLLLKMRSIHDQ